MDFFLRDGGSVIDLTWVFTEIYGKMGKITEPARRYEVRKQ